MRPRARVRRTGLLGTRTPLWPWGARRQLAGGSGGRRGRGRVEGVAKDGAREVRGRRAG